jgi:hypothetical protein
VVIAQGFPFVSIQQPGLRGTAVIWAMWRGPDVRPHFDAFDR